MCAQELSSGSFVLFLMGGWIKEGLVENMLYLIFVVFVVLVLGACC